MKNIERLISRVRPYAVRVDAKSINNKEKYTTIVLELGPKKTVNIPP